MEVFPHQIHESGHQEVTFLQISYGSIIAAAVPFNHNIVQLQHKPLEIQAHQIFAVPVLQIAQSFFKKPGLPQQHSRLGRRKFHDRLRKYPENIIMEHRGNALH